MRRHVVPDELGFLFVLARDLRQPAAGAQLQPLDPAGDGPGEDLAPGGERGIVPTLAAWRKLADAEDAASLTPYGLFYAGWHAALANREAGDVSG